MHAPRRGAPQRPFGLVDLNQLTQETLDDLSAEVEASGATVHVGELPSIHADALQMRQLLQNLLSNAIKFRRQAVPPEIGVEAEMSDGKLLLTVKDNGIGFEPQYSGRIFRVFERLHGRSQYPGTGIGLALCRKIVERHGGSIGAEGELGVGSIFTVTLPIFGPDALSGPPPAPPNGAATRPERAHVGA